MNIKEKINKDYIEAFKSKNSVAKNLLSVVKGEIQTIEKNLNVVDLSDEDVIKILNKTAKSLKETQSKFANSQTAEELFIIESYLPKQMSEDEIRSKINELKNNGINTIPEIMKEFSNLPADRKLVSKLFNETK